MNDDEDDVELPRLYVKSTSHKEDLLVESAATNKMVNIFKLLSERVPVDSRDQTGRTALHRASEAGHFQIVKILLANKADVNCTDGNGVQALHLAAFKEHLSTVQLLILGGADLEKTTRNGLRPIDYAMYDSDVWKILNNASKGIRPNPKEIIGAPDLPFVPKFSIPYREMTPEDVKKKLMLQERNKKNKKNKEK